MSEQTIDGVPVFYAIDPLDAYPEPVGTDDKIERSNGALWVHLNGKRSKLIGLQSLDFLISQLVQIKGEVFGTKPAAQPQGVPEIPKHLNYATVLVLQEGESEYGEALYGRDGEFRFGYGESALTDVEKWMPLPRREAPAPVAVQAGDSVDFRLLLNKYIEHVGQCEGTDFISHIGDGPGSDVPFGPAETEELKRLQEYPMKELGALPNDLETSIGFIGFLPKGAGRLTIGKGAATPRFVLTSGESARHERIAVPQSRCKACGDRKQVVLAHDANGILLEPCPHCLPKPPPAGSDRISMKGAIIQGNGGPNPITYTGNGAIVNLDGYVLYAPGAHPVEPVKWVPSIAQIRHRRPERNCPDFGRWHDMPIERYNKNRTSFIDSAGWECETRLLFVPITKP